MNLSDSNYSTTILLYLNIIYKKNAFKQIIDLHFSSPSSSSSSSSSLPPLAPL